MTFLVLLIIFVLIAGGLILYGLGAEDGGPFLAGGIAFGVVFIGGLLLFSSIHNVGSHQVGVVTGLSGQVVGALQPGTHTVSPLDSVDTQDTGIQSTTFSRLTAVSKDSQDVFVDVQVNYHLDPVDVVSLYRSVGGNWYDKFVPGAVTQAVKEETVRFYTVDLAPNRAHMSQDIESSLKNQLEPHSIHVDSVYLLNVDYSQQFKQAIEAKQVASQQAAAAVLQSDRQRNIAAGDRDAAIIRAEGQAKANQLISKSLTPQIIQFEWAQKLAPNVKVFLPSSGIYNISGLTK